MDSTKQLFQGHSTGFVKWWNKRQALRCKTRRTVTTIYHPCKDPYHGLSTLVQSIFRDKMAAPKYFAGIMVEVVLLSFHLVHHLVEIVVRGLIACHYFNALLNNVCHMLHEKI